jgi:hypothetical protein
MLPLALGCLAACAPAKPAGEGVDRPVQIVFTHFKGERVSLSVNGKIEFDQAVSVAPGNARHGIAAVAQVKLSDCSDVVVQSGTQRVAQQLCLKPDTKSITIDGGQPLSITQLNYFQGLD